jgi:NADH-quinone oxidoreductase subunit A
MPPTPTEIVAYLALFATVAFLFVLASLILGWFLRASVPTQQKLEAYECGEPAIGPGTVQFDLRFYVVALLFLIFEVEVAFFFPPATIFGTALHPDKAHVAAMESVAGPEGATSVAADAKTPASSPHWRTLALASMIDLGIFFAVLLVGFAFIWRRGDLDWVRAVRHPATPAETAALVARLQRGELSI